MNKIIVDKLCIELAETAQRAILYEAVLTPKPGLVDAVDQGSHKDMNVFTFIDSSVSMYHSFYNYAYAGLTWEQDEKLLFSHIREVGKVAETKMFKATKNINTHKGINFSLGLLVAATGYYLQKSHIQDLSSFSSLDSSNIANIVKSMTKGLVKSDYKNIHEKEILTNGEKLYLKTGFAGIRGEAEAGFPSVFGMALSRLRHTSKLNISTDRKLLDVLFHIMMNTSDSNVVNRGGEEALTFVKSEASKFVENNIIFQDNYKEKINELNEVFKNKNISPGGSADLLSLTIYFALLESLI